MDNPANGGDLTGYASVGALIATAATGIWAVISGKAGHNISQVRYELSESLSSLSDILLAQKEIISGMREMLVRLVATQENIARMMQEQRESEKALESQANLLRILEVRELEKNRAEREIGRQRERDRNRPQD